MATIKRKVSRKQTKLYSGQLQMVKKGLFGKGRGAKMYGVVYDDKLELFDPDDVRKATKMHGQTGKSQQLQCAMSFKFRKMQRVGFSGKIVEFFVLPDGGRMQLWAEDGTKAAAWANAMKARVAHYSAMPTPAEGAAAAAVPPPLPAPAAAATERTRSPVAAAATERTRSPVVTVTETATTASTPLTPRMSVPPSVRLQLSAETMYNIAIPEEVVERVNFRPLPMGQRTLHTSNFKQIYGAAAKARVPRLPAELLTSVTKLVEWFAVDKGLDRKGTETFLQEINGEAFKHHKQLVKNLGNAAEYLWTCAKMLPNDMEFCGLVNEALRRDEPTALLHAVVLVNAINRSRLQLREASASGAKNKHKFPNNGLCYRGGGFRNQFCAFYTPGKQFRSAQFVATSFSKNKARQFIARAPGEHPRIFWTIQVDLRGRDDPVYRTKHVSYVKKTLVKGEEEYLFAPYSAFTVQKCQWSSSLRDIHEVLLAAAVDNKHESEHLPLAPWI